MRPGSLDATIDRPTEPSAPVEHGSHQPLRGWYDADAATFAEAERDEARTLVDRAVTSVEPPPNRVG